MSAQFMRRNIRISVRLTEEEHRLLKEKMARIGVTNQEAFLRKMALDGLVIKLDLPELKQMISLLRYTSNNINQIARAVNARGFASGEDIAAITAAQETIWNIAERLWHGIHQGIRHPRKAGRPREVRRQWGKDRAGRADRLHLSLIHI